MRSPTEMGYEELSENILAGMNVDEKKLSGKAVNYKFKFSPGFAYCPLHCSESSFLEPVCPDNTSPDDSNATL